MRSLKLAKKQKEMRKGVIQQYENESRRNQIMGKKKMCDSENEQKQIKVKSIFLNSEEAIVWIKKEFNRKEKNEFLQLIRKRNLEGIPGVRNIPKIKDQLPIAIQLRSKTVVTKRKAYLSLMKSEESLRNKSDRLHSMGKTTNRQKKNSQGFLTIQTLDTSTVREKLQTRIRVRTEKSHRFVRKKEYESQSFEDRQQVRSVPKLSMKEKPKLKLDKNSFHFSQLGPWD